jgi:single-strand DNA-binding protein
MLNKTLLIGNLTTDPQKFDFKNSALCKFPIAVQSSYKNEEVLFIEVNCWNKTAENCEKYLKKGSRVLVEGRLKLEKWQDKQQNNKSKISVVAENVKFMPSANSDQADKAAPTPSSKENISHTKSDSVIDNADEDEELLSSIPF